MRGKTDLRRLQNIFTNTNFSLSTVARNFLLHIAKPTHLVERRSEGEGRHNIGPRSPLLSRRLPAPHVLGHLSPSHATLSSPPITSNLQTLGRITACLLKRQLQHQDRQEGTKAGFLLYAIESLATSKQLCLSSKFLFGHKMHRPPLAGNWIGKADCLKLSTHVGYWARWCAVGGSTTGGRSSMAASGAAAQARTVDTKRQNAEAWVGAT